MRYYELGKVSHSNISCYIGGFLSVSKPNYDIICETMNIFINRDFKKYKHCFMYGVNIKNDYIKIQGGHIYYKDKNIASYSDGIITNQISTIKVILDVDNYWDIDLIYNLYMESPFRISKLNIVRSFD